FYGIDYIDEFQEYIFTFMEYSMKITRKGGSVISLRTDGIAIFPEQLNVVFEMFTNQNDGNYINKQFEDLNKAIKDLCETIDTQTLSIPVNHTHDLLQSMQAPTQTITQDGKVYQFASLGFSLNGANATYKTQYASKFETELGQTRMQLMRQLARL